MLNNNITNNNMNNLTKIENVIKQLQLLKVEEENKIINGVEIKDEYCFEMVIEDDINCSHIESNIDIDNCPICLEGFGEVNKVVLPCSHTIHLDCYNSFLFTGTGFSNCKKCPLCRVDICNLPVGFGRVIEELDFERQRERQRENDRIEMERNRIERERNREIEEINRLRLSGDLVVNGFENIDLLNDNNRTSLLEQGRTIWIARLREERIVERERTATDFVYFRDNQVRVMVRRFDPVREFREINEQAERRGRLERQTFRSNNIAILLMNGMVMDNIYSRYELMEIGLEHNRGGNNVNIGITRLRNNGYIYPIRYERLRDGEWVSDRGYMLI